MSKSTKSPPAPIVEGGRVRKRGLGHLGTVSKLGNDPSWVHVEWDEGSKAIERPKICARTELEAVT